jgi:hypothetical protein
MSNLEPLTTQPDWRDQYSQYLPSAENVVLSPPFEQSIGSHQVDAPVTQQLFAPRPPLNHRHSLAQVSTETSRQESFPNPPIERPDSAPALNGLRQDAFKFPESTTLPGINTASKLLTPPPLQVKSEETGNNEGNPQQVEPKEEEEEDDDDDDEMLDAEDPPAPNPAGVQQTEAERRAERRKMKRFR